MMKGKNIMNRTEDIYEGAQKNTNSVLTTCIEQIMNNSKTIESNQPSTRLGMSCKNQTYIIQMYMYTI
jgi:hypothetical protein